MEPFGDMARFSPLVTSVLLMAFRYGAAFIGFDDFVLVRQAILLTIDTFGFSHILPIFGLPFLVARQHMLGQTDQDRRLPSVQLFLMYLMYKLIGLYCHSNYNLCDHTEATSNGMGLVCS
ncbi:hypothetical protein Patl1_05659 [Pistacia atlantica]|uniref:Uncharacterized protein n=1 Tax=Pistacia atlantica TaxID=434234 RepID=A0ACC1BWI3_9ROSI|nr:hypothetical protein Patl1_05659 [Pistacia atlantica]